MNALWCVIAVAIAAGVGAPVAGLDEGAVRAVRLGMAGPVVMAAASWTMTSRTWAREQAALLPWMLRAFAVKVMLVVAYVVGMLSVVDARPEPFVLSFILTFMATHFAEAYCLRRLTAADSVERRLERNDDDGTSS